jgi:upstream activation factor subunit UAF30|uniref:DM2 domain-containing protein n=1 Tax=viral metagenome TaxID=1070528 RepID=A0A6C0IQN8_9ZZZZ
MVRATKTEKTTAPETPKPRAKKAAPKTEAQVATPPPAPVVEETAAPEEMDAVAVMAGKMNEYSAKLQQLVGLLSTLKSDFKTLEKTVSREMKVAQKLANKKRRNTNPRKPSGFTKATPISEELANFLGKSVGTEMARTEVSKEITKYIKSNNLQDVSNGRVIKADAKLSKLLRLGKEDELTFFNLQRYMKIHFAKAGETI